MLVMLFVMSFGNMIFAQGTNPGNMFSNSGEKVDVLVGFHGPPNRGLVERFGGEIYREFSIVNAIAVSLPQQAIGALARNPAVSYVEPDGQVYATAQTVPWGIDRVFGVETYSFDTWGISKGSGVGVAVLDTGIDINHPDLEFAGGRRFYMVTTGPPGQRGLREDDNYNDVNGHGTHVAGTIAALDNELGVVGVAPEVALYAVKVLGDNGSGSISTVVAGIDWAVDNGIPIINMSLGSSSHSQTLKDACDNAYQEGHLLVSSAGNSGNSEGTGDNVGYPAKYPSVIAVAASNSSNKRAWFSSTGPDVELIAPGVGVLSTVPDGYASYNGTSMASPHVAGTAALVWAADSGLSNEEVRSILRDTAEDLGLAINHQGYGMVRADLAVKEVVDAEPTYTLTLDVSPDGGGTVTGAGNYKEEDNVSLTAAANPGYEFVNWTEGETEISNKPSFTFTMPDNNVTLVANFIEKITIPDTYQLTMAVNPSVGGMSYDLTGESSYKEGAEVSIKAVAAEGYEFVAWTATGGSFEDAGNLETIFHMPGQDMTVTANFKEIQLEDPPSVGEVTVSGINYTTSGGRLQDRHLHITIALKDDEGKAVSGAAVSIEVYRNSGLFSTSSGTTGSDGTVTFNYSNHPSGVYTTKTIQVVAEGLVWDGKTPDNSYEK